MLAAFATTSPPVLAASPVYADTTMPAYMIGQNGSRLYGERASNARWCYSDDDGATWTDVGTTGPVDAFGAGHRCIELIFGGGYMFALEVQAIASGSANAGTATAPCKVWRATAGDFSSWTNITPGDLPTGTVGRPSVLVYTASRLFLGNYGFYTPQGAWPGAFVWKSTAADGSGLTKVMTAATARHVHAIRPNPADGTKIAVSVGDTGGADAGLWYSGDSGANWTKRNALTRYGIDIVWQDASGIVPARLVLDGDFNPLSAHVIDFLQANLTGSTGEHRTVIWPDCKLITDPTTWGGTGRGVYITAEGNLYFQSSCEAASLGTRYGVWLAKGPEFRFPVLLEEITEEDNVVSKQGKTYESGAYLLNTRKRMLRPKFVGQ